MVSSERSLPVGPREAFDYQVSKLIDIAGAKRRCDLNCFFCSHITEFGIPGRGEAFWASSYEVARIIS